MLEVIFLKFDIAKCNFSALLAARLHGSSLGHMCVIPKKLEIKCYSKRLFCNAMNAKEPNNSTKIRMML